MNSHSTSNRFIVLFFLGLLILAAGMGALVVNTLKLTPFETAEYWQEITKSDELSVVTPDLDFISYLKERSSGFVWESLSPAPADNTATTKVRTAFAEIPATIRSALGSRIVAVVLVEGLRSGTLSIEVFSEGKAVGVVLIVNREILDQTVSQWATARERLPFETSALGIRVQAERLGQYSSAITYILLHEGAHGLSLDHKMIPERRAAIPKDISSYAFSGVSWFSASGKLESKYQQSLATRVPISFYGESAGKFPQDKVLELYDRLAATDFPTLHAMTNPFDDFAESFAHYVYTQIMQRPFDVFVESKDFGDSKVYRPCWQESRCLQKAGVLAEYIRNLDVKNK